jgi:hypothetical protein
MSKPISFSISKFELYRFDEQENEITIVLDVEGTYAYDAGYRSGPPDLCREASEDVSYLLYTKDGNQWDGELTSSEEDELHEKILDAVAAKVEEYDEEKYEMMIDREYEERYDDRYDY